MGVEFTRDVAKRHMEQARKARWEFYAGPSVVEAARTARDMGWADKKVQVRFVKQEDNTVLYYVEPYEKGCGCKGLLKYKDFFD